MIRKNQEIVVVRYIYGKFITYYFFQFVHGWKLGSHTNFGTTIDLFVTKKWENISIPLVIKCMNASIIINILGHLMIILK